MDQLSKFIQISKTIIQQKTSETINIFEDKLINMHQQQKNRAISTQQSIPITNQRPNQQNGNQSDRKTIINQKVLQIDVIESGYIPKSNEKIEIPTQYVKLQQKMEKSNEKDLYKSKYSRSPSRLNAIEMEKKNILEELKKLDQEIAQIKGQSVETGVLKRKEKMIEDQQARRQAKELVKQLKYQKKQIQERKKKETQKALLLLRQQEEDRRKRRDEEQIKLKEQKRKAIQVRIQEEKRKRQQRKQIDKQSNKLIQQLKKEEQILKKKQVFPAELMEIQQKKKIIQKKQQVNFRQIQEHQRKYLMIKQQDKQQKKQRSQSVNHYSVQKYQKNIWTEKLEEQEFKKRQQEKLKQLKRKAQLEKRLKYGELVKNIFLPKKKETLINPKIFDEQEEIQKHSTPNAINNTLLPKIPESQKRVTQSKAMKKFTQQNRPFATAHNYKKPPRDNKERQTKEPIEDIAEDIEKQRLRKLRQQQLRKQTKDRLKKLQNQSLDLLPQSKPKYQNYLGKVNVNKRTDSQSWKRIFDDNKLSKQQKYSEMLKKAAAMQSRAKMKEQFRKDGDQDAVNLYIGSIQAKLALLQKF